MIGQKGLINKLGRYTLKNLPHSILLLGDYGSEMSEICEFISDTFVLPHYEITELISPEYIDDIYHMNSPGLYIIDGDKITEREQNMLLKFYEEPTTYSYVVFMCSGLFNIIDTIISRSYIFQLDRYSKEDLIDLCSNSNKDLELELANTPGTVNELNNINLEYLKKLSESILTKISTASIPDVLTIVDKINFKDEYDKIPLWAFIKMLELTILELMKNGHPVNYQISNLINNFKKYYIYMTDKKRYLENLLINLWLVSKNGN